MDAELLDKNAIFLLENDPYAGKRKAVMKRALPLIEDLHRQGVSKPALHSIIGGIDATNGEGFSDLRHFNKEIRIQLTSQLRRWRSFINFGNPTLHVYPPSSELYLKLQDEGERAMRKIQKGLLAVAEVDTCLNRLMKSTVGKHSRTMPQIGHQLAALIERCTGSNHISAATQAWELLKILDVNRTPKDINSFKNSYRKYRDCMKAESDTLPHSPFRQVPSL